MNSDIHGRACRLIDVWHAEGISAPERDWLDAHLAECPACTARLVASKRALQALRSNSLIIDPVLVRTTQARVRWRARELRENRVRMRALWISCALSWVLGAASTPLVWQTFRWIGLHSALPKMIWETAFALWWAVPAGVVATLLAWQRQRAVNRDGYTTLPR